MDTTPLRDAYRALLDAAATVADSGDPSPVPPTGEWNADRILAHIAIVGAGAVTAVSCVATGAIATYDNRLAHDPWTLDRVFTLAGGNTGIRERIRIQGEALCALSGPTLSEAELDTPMPTVLVSHDAALVDGPVPLRDLLAGLAAVELPGHTRQLLALLPARAGTEGGA
ncbi:hypothetical protein OG948_44300 (plasmid) [Embleya sp. NBC_00888]|uniref:hypothetical protein n=1 Tax=Embleya sp. NBC_00888 TaxID=2975960 RepID=UPI002F915033|nr:hypothetical protein OG948_44300 [Embleya sp. NBC_00888]